jgi:phosphatidylserine/phosphatidylglycerophosphate/cardiolipin synthase-like enzyme
VVPILAVGRLGSGITHDFANQSDLARDLLLGAARRSIRIVQQDLAFMMGRLDPLYPESTLERMADFLLTDKGDLHIVLSDPKAVGNSGSSYGNGVSLEVIAHKIRQVARARSGLSDAALDSLLCRRLFLAPFRFGPDAMWPGGKPIGNHAKFWMVDDRVFYIGSDNFYPVDLQEFGYIVDHRAAAADVLRAYWTPLWSWSRRAAITGADAPRCIFATGGG